MKHQKLIAWYILS